MLPRTGGGVDLAAAPTLRCLGGPQRCVIDRRAASLPTHPPTPSATKPDSKRPGCAMAYMGAIPGRACRATKSPPSRYYCCYQYHEP